MATFRFAFRALDLRRATDGFRATVTGFESLRSGRYGVAMKPLSWTAILSILLGLAIALVSVFTWPSTPEAIESGLLINVVALYAAGFLLGLGVLATLLSMHAWTITTGFNDALVRQDARRRKMQLDEA